MKIFFSVLMVIINVFGLKNKKVADSWAFWCGEKVLPFMRNLRVASLLLLFILVCPLSSWATNAEAPKLLYLYGDVAADGTVPSGDKEPFHQMRLNDSGDRGLSGFAEAIRELGLQIEEAYDAEVTLTPEFLDSIDVLILGSNQRRFSAAEAQAVDEWVRSGGGLLGWSDSVFDRNMLWNAGEGTRLSHVDNREFAQRITAWAAGLESTVEESQAIQSSRDQELTEKPEVSARAEIDEQDQSILLIADIEDADGATLSPDVEWKSVRGPAPLQFANNNPYGTRIHASYETPGEYVVRVEVRGDGYYIHKQLRLDLP
jgi:hypothetical protein